MKAKRVALYIRVSKQDQEPENQKRELLAVARRHGWNVTDVFSDRVSGAKGKDDRRAFQQLHDAIARKRVDLVAAWSVDRIGRSLAHLVAFMQELKAKGIDLYLHNQNLDTSTPAGRAMFQMLGVFAEFERAMARERIMSGLARARAEGKHIGRPRTAAAVEAEIERRLDQGDGVGRVALALGVGTSVVQRIKKARRSAP